MESISKAGLTSMGTPQMDVKREMIRVADEVYVIADSSKFGSRNLFTVCPMSEVDRVITDTEIKRICSDCQESWYRVGSCLMVVRIRVC